MMMYWLWIYLYLTHFFVETIEVLGKEASKIAAPTKSTNQTQLIESLIKWSEVAKVT